MPLTAAYRYNADSRDDGYIHREAALAAYHNVSLCHYAAECSRVCPKGVDPARAIQLLKRELLLSWLHLKRPVPPSQPVGPPVGTGQQAVLRAPAFTVER